MYKSLNDSHMRKQLKCIHVVLYVGLFRVAAHFQFQSVSDVPNGR